MTGNGTVTVTVAGQNHNFCSNYRTIRVKAFFRIDFFRDSGKVRASYFKYGTVSAFDLYIGKTLIMNRKYPRA
jgi:hypothetical protein